MSHALTRSEAVALSAACLLLPHPAFGAGAEQDAQVPGALTANPRDTGDPIVVKGQRETSIIDGIIAEDELEEADISAYGADTVGDLLDQVASGIDASDDGPVVLINGQLANGIDDIADLPPEALRKIQLLPRDTASRIGQRPERRVVNIQLKPAFRQATLNAEGAFATAGKGTGAGAAAGYTKISGSNRTTITARMRDTDMLLESDRPILPTPAGATPYDLAGNVVALAGSGNEIDPMFSQLAGARVTVAAVPSTNPTLAHFVANANATNLNGIAAYRSLVPDSRTWSMNATLGRRLGPRTNVNITANGELTRSRSLQGAATALLRLDPANPASVFSQAVNVARYLPVPLEAKRQGGGANLAATINHNLGKWTGTLSLNYNHREDRTLTDRGVDTAALQAAIDANLFSPFAEVPNAFLGISRRDIARSNSDLASAQATLTGPAAKLPTGEIMVSLRGGGGIHWQRSESNGSLVSTRRNDANGQVSVDVPLASRRNNVLAAIGDLRANLALGLRNASGVGRLWNHAYGLNWQPVSSVSLRGGFTGEDIAPQLAIINAPVIVYPNVRFFDFIRNETVDVTVISGGNAALRNESRRTLSFGGTLALQDRGRLNLNADFTRTRYLNRIGALPPLNAEVQQAFADRFGRDDSGRLVRVDNRPVSFAREEHEQLRWGVNFLRFFGKSQVRQARQLARQLGTALIDNDEDGTAGSPGLEGPKPWRVNFSLNHTWTLKAQRLARAGLPIVDLLDGGAFGYGGGQARHAIQFNAGIAGKGFGLQSSGTWKGATSIRAGTTPSAADLRYAPRALIDVRLFADLGRVLPDATWASGTRVSINARNLFDSRQRVTDGTGNTPLRYQPYLLDAVGRSIQIGVRKTF